MTTAHSSTSFEQRIRHEPAIRAACLRLCWSVAPAALGRTGRVPLALELNLRSGEPPRVTLDGAGFAPASEWARDWNGTLAIRRVGSGQGKGLLIVEAAPIAVAVIDADNADRPLHVACDLPKALGLSGGRYEMVSGGLSA
ncbi:MAG: hypothetical protein NCW75_14575 [Phycisphaera sp.]|nr:MAG: hypothetical protein NCW75_14575 [Phycisphaera sp.]